VDPCRVSESMETGEQEGDQVHLHIPPLLKLVSSAAMNVDTNTPSESIPHSSSQRDVPPQSISKFNV
jgi:hypothetical protein